MTDFRLPNSSLVLQNVHDPEVCTGPHCPVHNPSEHSQGIGLLHWRYDRGIFERICRHGVGHYDPDQFAYHSSIGLSFKAVHGYDGCCQ